MPSCCIQLDGLLLLLGNDWHIIMNDTDSASFIT